MLTDSGLDTYLRKHTAQEEQNLLGATNDYPGIETITTASGELCYCFTPTPLSMQMALSENKVLANYQNFAVINVAAQNFCQNFSKLLTKLFGKYFRYL